MYLQHFNLIENPFGLTPDPDFLYLDAQHQSALQTLLLALEHGEGFVKVTGEVGTGKTLLCRRLMSSLPSNAVTAYIFNPRLDAVSLLRTLALELGLTPDPHDGGHTLYQLIESELLQLAARGQRVVCCVDEAHALPKRSLEALRLLSNLETRKRKLLQIALFGQPELDDMLRTPGLRSLASRIAFGAKLEGMPFSDFRRYLHHRMVVAGWRGHPVFSVAAASLLWRASGGVPRTANLLAHQCLMLAYGRGEHEVGVGDALAVWRERWKLLGGPVHRGPAPIGTLQGEQA